MYAELIIVYIVIHGLMFIICGLHVFGIRCDEGVDCKPSSAQRTEVGSNKTLVRLIPTLEVSVLTS